MKTIWKTTLRPTNSQQVPIPKGSRFISVANQNESICAWFEVGDERAICQTRVDQDAEFELVVIHVVGTGHVRRDIPDAARFIGTVLLSGGALVFHVYAEDDHAR